MQMSKKIKKRAVVALPFLYSRRESNSDQRFRKPLFYPLNYRSFFEYVNLLMF